MGNGDRQWQCFNRWYCNIYHSLTAFAVFILQAIRKIPVQYAKGQRTPGSQLAPQSTFLPLKVNLAGVIPVITCISDETSNTDIILPDQTGHKR